VRIAQEDFMNNCLIKGALSGVMGGLAGGAFGLFTASIENSGGVSAWHSLHSAYLSVCTLSCLYCCALMQTSNGLLSGSVNLCMDLHRWLTRLLNFQQFAFAAPTCRVSSLSCSSHVFISNEKVAASLTLPQLFALACVHHPPPPCSLQRCCLLKCGTSPQGLF